MLKEVSEPSMGLTHPLQRATVQVEDRQLITELVISKMNQLLSRTPVLSPQRPLTTQQPQVSREETQGQPGTLA